MQHDMGVQDDNLSFSVRWDDSKQAFLLNGSVIQFAQHLGNRFPLV